ncbi:hypothetical protein G7Y89_g8847 [Cudoniella acicularis]|uniref:Uncharacterized protein n=1 Tax=Cudoniella acicularis TaxID=354080 RepID=A0A8H4RIG1_9HELO|nr:hypothetical protein G7Y89_g8847 [Cudoniella acicularis]
MSSSQSYSYSSSSYSSSTSTNGGRRTGQAYQQTSHSNLQGTTIRTTSQNLGEPAIQETRRYDAGGNLIWEDGRVLGAGYSSGGAGRIEDISDERAAEKRYEENIEDEYAKREGGA